MSNAGSLTPNDLRNQEFERKMRGCDPVEVASVLEEAAAQWERLLAENLHLTEKTAALEQQIKKYADLEQTLRDTLIVARKAAEDEADNAKKEAKLVIDRAHLEADGIIKDAQARAEKFRMQMEQLRNARNRLKADLEGLLFSYTEQIRKLDDTQTAEIEAPVENEPLEEFSVNELPIDKLASDEAESPTIEFPDSSLTSAVEETGDPATRESLLAEGESELPDTSDAFDAALNKIFGSEAKDDTSDTPGKD